MIRGTLQRFVQTATGIAIALVAGCHQTGLGVSTALDGTVKSSDISATARAQQSDATPIKEKTKIAHALMMSTVATPELPRRPISLAECLALALENGRTASFFDGPGSTQRTSVSGLSDLRTPAGSTDSIRVYAYDPAIAATGIEEALSRFDVWSETSIFWNRVDQRSRFLSFLTPFDQVTNRNKLDDVDFSTGLFRRLPTGGFAGFRYSTGVERNDLTGPSTVINPAYRPIFDLTFEQPLLQGAGVLINQLRDQHPGSIRQTFPDAGRPPGIMLVRISHRQQQLEFERQVHELIYRVEESYWQLYSAYWDLYSSENGLKQAHAAWQVAKARFDAGGLGIEDLAMIEEQYHFFRNQRVQALGRGQPGRPGVLEAERRLRYVVGLPPEDGTRLTPLDAPEFLAYDPDLNLAVADAETFRPELKQVDEEIRAAELNLIRAKDRLKPDLRFVSRYGLNGLGQNLDESIEDQVQNPHHEWELGLRLQVPIGYRAGHADTARAHLQLTQRMAFLQDQREKLVFSIQRSYQELVQYREQYKIRIRQREAAALQLKARSEKFKAGGDPKQPGSFIDLLLRAQRNWADALREEYIALCNYRIAVTDFERQKGTILRYANIAIADGPAHDGMLPEASGHLRRWRNNRPCPAPIVVAAAHPTVPVVVADSFPVPDTSHARDTIGLVPPEPLPAPRQAQPENARPDGKEAMGGVNSAPVPESRPVVASSSAAAPANVADTPPRPSLGLPSTNGPNED